MLTTTPEGGVVRDTYPGRWRTRAGAQRAADQQRALAALLGVRLVVSEVEV